MSIKVFHLISSLHRGGRERQLATIVSSTDFKQYPTKILFFNMYQSSYINEYDLEDTTIHVQSHGKIARLKKIHQILKREKPDIIYTWGIGESVSILLLKPFHKFEFINGSVRHGIRSKKFSHYFRTMVLHLSRRVVANSKAGLYANNLKRGFVLHNGIHDKFLTPLKNRSDRRDELVNIPESTMIFVSVANLVPYKDYYTVLSALELIKNKGANFYYLILGDGPQRKNLEDFIKKAGLEDNVTIVGHVENVHEYLKISDVFIHSSKGEGCSNAILEAMAAGLPIIASNTGGTSEILSDKNGFLFNYQDVEGLYKLIKDSLLNINSLKKMGPSSKRMVEEKFTVNCMMTKYYNIIEKIALASETKI